MSGSTFLLSQGPNPVKRPFLLLPILNCPHPYHKPIETRWHLTFLFYKCLHTCLYTYMQCPQWPGKGIRSPASMTGGCERPSVLGLELWTPVTVAAALNHIVASGSRSAGPFSPHLCRLSFCLTSGLGV